jgi:hypothetical protein
MKDIFVGEDCALFINTINVDLHFSDKISSITYVNSVGKTLWYFGFHTNYGTDKTFIVSPDGKFISYKNIEDFLSGLKDNYPEDYEFFLWHPSAANGIWNE